MLCKARDNGTNQGKYQPQPLKILLCKISDTLFYFKHILSTLTVRGLTLDVKIRFWRLKLIPVL